MSEENDVVVLNRLCNVKKRYLAEAEYFRLICLIIGLARNILLGLLVVLLIFRINYVPILVVAVLLLIVVNLESFLTPWQNWKRTKGNAKLLESWKVQYLTGTYPFNESESRNNALLLMYIYQMETGVYDSDMYI